MTKLILFALFASVIVGCSSSSTSPATVTLGEQFQLEYGQSTSIREARLKLTFKALGEDSRCPEGAVCVWEGNARVVVSVSNVDASLNTTLEPKQISRMGYSIQLLAVNPTPKLAKQYEPEDYVITLVVMKE